MRMFPMMAPMTVALAALALAGCNKPATPGAKPSAGAPSAASATVTLPDRKAGLWEQTMSRDGKPAMGPMGGKMSVCLDAATSQKMSVFGRQFGRGMCEQPSVSRGLDGTYTFASSCDSPGGGKIVSKGTASGDFNSHYEVHSQTDITGARMERMNGHHEMVMTGDWKGPCPPDMKAGDVVMGNGFKVNVADMMDHGRDAVDRP
jgi:hypothetical protein